MTEKRNFYYRGYYFSTMDEMLKFADTWNDHLLDVSQLKKDFDSLMEEIILNNNTHDFTNLEAWKYILYVAKERCGMD